MDFTYETEKVEFKKSTAELKEGIISLAAMLNKHGYGEVYFGVKNDGTIQGQQIGDSTLRDISQAVANFIKPQIIPVITIELADDKNIIRLSAKGKEKPYSAYGKYYIRSADEDREASPSQLRQMMVSTTIESIVNVESNDQSLQFLQLKSLYLEQGFTVNEEAFLLYCLYLWDINNLIIICYCKFSRCFLLNCVFLKIAEYIVYAISCHAHIYLFEFLSSVSNAI